MFAAAVYPPTPSSSKRNRWVPAELIAMKSSRVSPLRSQHESDLTLLHVDENPRTVVEIGDTASSETSTMDKPFELETSSRSLASPAPGSSAIELVVRGSSRVTSM